jgi:hypothetical protein
MTAHRYSFFNLISRWQVEGQRYAPAALPPGKRPGTLFTGGWWGAETVWTGAENLVLTGIRSPDRPARSESLYRLSHRDPHRFSVHPPMFAFSLPLVTVQLQTVFNT